MKKKEQEYVSNNENNQLSINQLQIDDDKKYDGFKAISSSTKIARF